MLVKIEPIQIPACWDMIKYAAKESDGIKEEYQEEYFLNLLQDLLSSIKTCFVGIENNEYTFCVICSFHVEKLMNIKYMLIDNLFSFKPQKNETWQIGWSDLETIAKNNSCEVIGCHTTNDRIIDIISFCGGELYTKTFYKFLR